MADNALIDDDVSGGHVMVYGGKGNSLPAIMAVLLTWSVAAAAVGDGTTSKTNAKTRVRRLPIHQLKNMTYKNEGATHNETPLRKGKFDDKPYEPGMASHLAVRFGDKVAYGDLNGDSTPDAAVILWEDGGGSGTFANLAVVLNRNGKPRHLASELLGDRVKIRSIRIRNRIVTVDMLTQGPNDPMSEPRQRVIRRYTLNHDKLVPLRSQRQ
jgi:hypothetical protein